MIVAAACRLAAGLAVVGLIGACSASVTIEYDDRATLPDPAPTADAGDEDPTPTPEGQPDEEPTGPDPEDVDTGDLANWTDAECEFGEPPDVSTSCGWLDVPQDWSDPAGPTLRLHVGIFSTGPKDTEPIVYLEGGPGGDPFGNLAGNFETLFGDLVAVHDIVVMGQRGTAGAEPELQCDEAIELGIDLLDDPGGPEEELPAFADAYAACADDFASRGVDTTAYNSIQNAHDVDALRGALGHDQWNVLGVSYGTRLGQTLMRLHPGGIRAIVLDSAVPTWRDPTVDQPVTAQRAFTTLWEACAASAICGAAYPDLEARFFAQVDALDAAPVELEVSNVVTGARHPALLDGDGLMELAFSALYGKPGVAGLPELVAQLEQGDTSGVATLGSQNITSEEFVAAGMYWSVECNEEVPFVDQTSLDAGLTGDPRYDRLRPDIYTTFLDEVCAAFASGEAPPVEDEPVVSDLPTLVLGGTHDPITPPADGASLLEGLPAGFFVELPHTSHGAIVDPCAQAMVLGFLAEPTAPIDDSCVADVEEPDWAPDLFADLEFEEFSYDQGLYSASGVRPTGWLEVGDGTFAKSDNLLHTSAVLQQVVPRSPRDLVLGSLGGALGTEFEAVDELEAGGRSWTRYEGDVPGSIVDIVLTEDDEHLYLVLLQHAPADHDRAVEALLPPILEAVGP